MKASLSIIAIVLFLQMNLFAQAPKKTSDSIESINRKSRVVNGRTNNSETGNVGIGTSAPNASSKLEISSTSQGFLPPRMTVAQRDLISNPAEGLMIFNLSSGCPNYYFSGRWYEWCGTGVLPLATISSLDCASLDVNGILFAGVSASSVTMSISYTGGNEGTFDSQTINSTGVSGLVANHTAGQIANGSGKLIYSITGTPDQAGTATFAISFGGFTCNVNLYVEMPAPQILFSVPSSPSRTSTTPNLTVSGFPGSQVHVYSNTSCGGVFSGFGTIAPDGYATIPVNAQINATTSFTANARDGAGNVSTCSSSFNYTHDDVAPAAPVIVSSSPASPNRTSTTPLLTITGEIGATIRIYFGSSCSGTSIASGVIGAGGFVSIPVSAYVNATTLFTATATDEAGNVSVCSSSFSYTHDAIPPSAPVIVSSTPSSPNNASTTPRLNITGQEGVLIRIYFGNTCSGLPVATGIIVGGVASIQVTATPLATTTFTATAVDAAGNVSACSNTFSYTHTL